MAHAAIGCLAGRDLERGRAASTSARALKVPDPARVRLQARRLLAPNPLRDPRLGQLAIGTGRERQLGHCPVLRRQDVQVGLLEAERQIGQLREQIHPAIRCLLQLGHRTVKVVYLVPGTSPGSDGEQAGGQELVSGRHLRLSPPFSPPRHFAGHRDRVSPGRWSPLTESNRRPSPYHGHDSPPWPICLRRQHTSMHTAPRGHRESATQIPRRIPRPARWAGVRGDNE
jgi:hypothetical protein